MIALLGGIIGPKAAELLGKVLPYILTAILIAAAFALGRCNGVSDERARNTLALSRANAAALRIKAAADEIAANQRLRDALRLNTVSKERTDAIDKAPASQTGAATRALNCARWMQQNPGGADRAPAGC